jgi:25S rRNA (uracil2634-N3)-methyltransferase
VNRQVRYNQELLTGFFKSATSLLKSSGDGTEEGSGTILITLFEGQPYELWNIRDLARHSGLVVRRSFAFKAEAYPGYSHARTLGVVKKGGGGGQPQAKRKLNDNEDEDQEDGDDDEDEGRGEVSETAWRGELRAARTYEFGLKPDVKSGETVGRHFATGSNFTPLVERGAVKKKNKGKGGDSDSDSD